MKVRDAQAPVHGVRYLLDVNVLIALIDTVHVFHQQAHRWFRNEGSAAWATCPMTQNGVIRIVGHPSYRNFVGNPASVEATMALFCAAPGHAFWPDDISLLDPACVDGTRLLEATQITDTYLLALAVRHGGKLVTFDKRLVADAVFGGKAALHLIT